MSKAQTQTTTSFRKRWAGSRAVSYVLAALFFLLIALAYHKLSCAWSDFCDMPNKFFLFEYPVIVLIGFIFYVPRGSFTKNLFAFLAASLPVMGLYAIFDVFYDLRHHAARFSDMRELVGLWTFSPTLFLILVGVVVVSIFPSAFFFWKEIRLKRVTLWGAIFRCVMTAAIIFIVFTSVVAVPYQERVLRFVAWSDYENILENGRLANVIYYSNTSSETATRLAEREKKTVRNPLIPKRTGWKKRNIYIVVMESFMDPRYLKRVSFSRSPLYEKMERLLGNSRFDVAVSPVYGGNTAQAEFEILCGTPGLRKIESIEFNVFDGEKVKSLVTTLKEYGYTSVASVASDPIFFNSAQAYKSLGFDEIYFAGENNVYKKIGEGPHMFDGDLLEQNIGFVQSHLLTSGKPFINYVVGMYGHMPFSRDQKRHPDVLSVSVNGRSVDDINEVSNQFYYRTKAIYDFLSKLRQIDPDAIVLIIADHLPPVLNKEVQYSMNDYDDIFLLFNGRTRAAPPRRMRYYQIPYLVMSMLSGSKVKVPDMAALEDLYFDILVSGSGIQK